MNTQKSVYNRLFSKEEKTELESQKIELSLLSDMNKQFKEVQKNTSKLLNIRKEFIDKSKQLKSFGEIVQEQGKRLKELSLDLETKAKDLGLNTPKEVDFYKNQANDFIATGEDAVKRTR